VENFAMRNFSISRLVLVSIALILASIALGQAATEVGKPKNDKAQTNAAASIFIPVLMNDPSGSELLTTSSPRAAIQSNQIFYTPGGFTGNDTFSYTTQGGTATVTVAVTPAPPTPAGGGPPVNDLVITERNTPINIRVLDNDPVGSLLIGINNPPVELPDLTFGNAATFGNLIRYTPLEDYVGPDSFTYQTQTGTAIVNVNIVDAVTTRTATVVLRNEFNTVSRFRVTTTPGLLIDPVTGERFGFQDVPPFGEVTMLVEVTAAVQSVGFEATQQGIGGPLSASATGNVFTNQDTAVIFQVEPPFIFDAFIVIQSPPPP
jgi:hypothetical protein